MSIPTGYDAQTGQMDFSLALREMKKGKSVKRPSWWSAVRLNGEEFQWESGEFMLFLPSDLLATDWEEVL